VTRTRSVLIFGATGLIGRWLTKELLNQGAHVTVAIRTPGSLQALQTWLTQHGHTASLESLTADVSSRTLHPQTRTIGIAACTVTIAGSPVHSVGYGASW